MREKDAMPSLILPLASSTPRAGLSVESAFGVDGNPVVLPSFRHPRDRSGPAVTGIAMHGVSPNEKLSDGVSRRQAAGQTGAADTGSAGTAFSPPRAALA
jgi:hypothetical protein